MTKRLGLLVQMYEKGPLNAIEATLIHGARHDQFIDPIVLLFGEYDIVEVPDFTITERNFDVPCDHQTEHTVTSKIIFQIATARIRAALCAVTATPKHALPNLPGRREPRPGSFSPHR